MLLALKLKPLMLFSIQEKADLRDTSYVIRLCNNTHPIAIDFTKYHVFILIASS
jgi:hypothetical protein